MSVTSFHSSNSSSASYSAAINRVQYEREEGTLTTTMSSTQSSPAAVDGDVTPSLAVINETDATAHSQHSADTDNRRDAANLVKIMAERVRGIL